MPSATSVRSSGKQYQLNIYVDVNSDRTAAEIHCCSFSYQLQIPISKALAGEKELEPRSHAQASLELEKKDRMRSCFTADFEGTAAAPNSNRLAVQLEMTRFKSVAGEKKLEPPCQPQKTFDLRGSNIN